MNFWGRWISKSIYRGRWRESVERSTLALKLLTFEPTGAIVAAPTFSLPEHIGGQASHTNSPETSMRSLLSLNRETGTTGSPDIACLFRGLFWFRYTWIRDSSFTLDTLLRLGYTEEAEAYINFIFNCTRKRRPDGSLYIMCECLYSRFIHSLPSRYTIRGLLRPLSVRSLRFILLSDDRRSRH
jgi:GH15 family glucan-1,4-alpha-glucosidase